MKCRPEYDMEVIGRNLRHLREAKNLTVEEVREYLCLGSVQAVYKYEKGKSYPQADTMFALMELYEADLYDITVNHEEDPEPGSSAIFERLKQFLVLRRSLNDRTVELSYACYINGKFFYLLTVVKQSKEAGNVRR